MQRAPRRPNFKSVLSLPPCCHVGRPNHISSFDVTNQEAPITIAVFTARYASSQNLFLILQTFCTRPTGRLAQEAFPPSPFPVRYLALEGSVAWMVVYTYITYIYMYISRYTHVHVSVYGYFGLYEDLGSPNEDGTTPDNP